MTAVVLPPVAPPPSTPPRWAPTRRWAWASAAFAVAAVVLAVAAISWRTHAERPHLSRAEVDVTDYPWIVIASDCPAELGCVVVAPRTSTVHLAVAAFPGSKIVHADALATLGQPSGPTDPSGVGATDRHAVRESLDLRTPAGVLVHVASRCVAHAGPAVAAQSAHVPRRGPVAVFVLVPRAGTDCSAAVVLQAPTGVVVPWAAAIALAHRPDLLLAPS